MAKTTNRRTGAAGSSTSQKINGDLPENSKFIKALSQGPKGVMDSRALNLFNSTKVEMDAAVTEIKRQIAKKNNELTNLTDLAPDNSYSLRPGGPDFDPAKWVKDCIELQLDIEELELRLSVTEKFQKEWFG